MKNWKNTIKRGWIHHKLYQGNILKHTEMSVGGLGSLTALHWTEYSQGNFRMIERKDVDD